MKRKINEVVLRFFEDDARGDWGLTHKDTLGDGNLEGFNAFWDGKGIFHDVFEHWHEHTHPYFRGENAMNIGGEMAAMGAMWYYIDELGVGSARLEHGYYSQGDNMRRTTEDLVHEAIAEADTRFGSVLSCGVPKQKDSFNSELEWQIEKMWKNVKACKVQEPRKGENWTNEWEIEAGRAFKDSVTMGKIANLHRFGFKMARQMIPNCYENNLTLRGFIQFWTDFCKRNRAEELSPYIREIRFELYREGKMVSWKAFAVLNEGGEIEINEHFSLDDCYVTEEAEAS